MLGFSLMGDLHLKTRSSEVVLLPGNVKTAIGDDQVLGPHTVAISGYIDVDLAGPTDDDVRRTVDIIVDIDDVLWKPEFLQASTMASWGVILSQDSDEVDHSAWGIRSVKTGHTDVASGTIVRKLRLRMEVLIQGDGNWWRRIGFQTIANGTLSDVRDFLAVINQTEEIPDFARRERIYPPMEEDTR